MGYLLYGPDAKWQALPEPLIGSSTGKVIGSSEELQQQIIPLHQFGVEWDADGNVVGFGLSLTPTPHSYIINDRQFYMWCAGMRSRFRSCTKPAL